MKDFSAKLGEKLDKPEKPSVPKAGAPSKPKPGAGGAFASVAKALGIEEGNVGLAKSALREYILSVVEGIEDAEDDDMED